VPLHEGLGEVFGRLELRSLLRWSEDLKTAGAEKIHNAFGKRCFGADDGKVDFVLLGKARKFH
jgi:predicted RNA-binding protein with PUA domain